ncbi:MAG: AAA family ATPase, partial [Planctomycetota bacterium]
ERPARCAWCPGYVGFEQGGKLTEAVRRRPYSVILLDEIEKAHDDVYNILLQVLDDGRLTDSHGNTVDFTNTIVVMTSNVGSQLIQRIAADGGSEDEMREGIEESIRARFAPELLNRMDEKIVFQPLSKSEIRKIVELQIEILSERLAEQELNLIVTEAAVDAVAGLGYDPIYGARPLKRIIQNEVVNPLATKLLKGVFNTGDEVVIEFQENEFVIKLESAVSRHEAK